MIPFSRISILSHLVGPQVHFGQLLQLVFVVSLYFLVQVLCAYHMAKREPTSRRNQPRQSSFLDKGRTNVTVGGSNQSSGIKYEEKILCRESNGVAQLILGNWFSIPTTWTMVLVGKLDPNTPRLVSLMSRLHPCHHGWACFVPEPGQNIHRPLSKKKQAGSKWVGLCCQCLVLVRSDFDSISGSAVRVSAPHQNLFGGWVNTTLGRTGSLTLPQLCQNYMTLDRLIPPSNA